MLAADHSRACVHTLKHTVILQVRLPPRNGCARRVFLPRWSLGRIILKDQFEDSNVAIVRLPVSSLVMKM